MIESMSEPEASRVETSPLHESGVGRTSLLIAAWRARESERIDPLFVDPAANIFVTPAMEPWIDGVTRASASTCELIGYRTRYFDDYLAGEMERGVAQVVLLGAGLDTRSLRLGTPSVSFYEVDRPEVLAYKQRQLERHGYASPSRFIGGDYLRDDVVALLENQGFQAGAETYFIWEGNTMYLPADEIVALLRRLKAGLPDFRISFDYVSEGMIRGDTGFEGAGSLVAGFEGMGAPWVTGFADIAPVAGLAGLAVLEDKRVADAVVAPSSRAALDRDLFRHYSVCTLGSHE